MLVDDKSVMVSTQELSTRPYRSTQHARLFDSKRLRGPVEIVKKKIKAILSIYDDHRRRTLQGY